MRSFSPLPASLFCVLLLSCVLPQVVVSAEEDRKSQLTQENYDEMTKDRAVLIRFVTEWCGEKCEETQSDWDKLSKEWEAHPIGVVAEVYCDSEDGDMVCEAFEVSGYPSVFYGDPSSPEIYAGNLDYESLSKFANENIVKLPCSLRNLEACDDATKQRIESFQSKNQEELEKLEKLVLDKVGLEQTKFDKTAMELQKKYEDMANAFNKKIDKLREDTGFKWIQQALSELEDASEIDDEEEDSENDEL